MDSLTVEVTRAEVVECRHQIHLVIASPDGLEIWGDGQRPTFPRSAAKLIFALPLVESGAANAHRLTDKELALACSSHSGEDDHVHAVRAWLSALGLDDSALACGPSWPMHEPCIQHHETPLAITNCCSGKHTGFLTLAEHMGWSKQGYNLAHHSVQRTLADTLESVMEAPVGPLGIDGCNIPTYANTLVEIAHGFFNLTQAKGVRGQAVQRLVAAHKLESRMIGGTDRLCTEANALLDSGMVKFGADGVYVGMSLKKNVAFALKGEDGSMRGAETALVWTLQRLGLIEPGALGHYLPKPITARDGTLAGEVRISV